MKKSYRLFSAVRTNELKILQKTIPEKYFLKAIELGNNDDPKYNLGILYKVQGKFTQAKKYLIPLAQKGKIDAMINTGAIYRDEKDYKNAKKYYKMAADLGNEEALEIYNRLVLAGY